MALKKILSAESPPSSNKEECEMKYRTAILTRMKKEEEYDIVLEKQRVKTVAREHAEINPPYT